MIILLLRTDTGTEYSYYLPLPLNPGLDEYGIVRTKYYVLRPSTEYKYRSGIHMRTRYLKS